MPDPPSCLLVRPTFRSRESGGRAQRFCKMSCRRAFHAAARRWALDAVDAGVLTLGDIKQGFQPTRALSQAT